jgi:repressor LexA
VVTAGQQAATIVCAMKLRFTEKQGQYLAFIYYYTKVNGRPPAEADMQRYFRVTPPSVHRMVITLELNGFIERIPGQGRSIRLLIPREQLPDLK